MEEVRERVDTWKRGALREAYHAQAQQWHPDKGPAEEREERTRRMAEVNEAHRLAQTLEVQRRAPQPPPQAVRVVVRYGYARGMPGWSTLNASTTSAATDCTDGTGFSFLGGWPW